MDRKAIIILPHPSLSKRSRKIGKITEAVKALGERMAAITLDWEDHRDHEFGVALAAVQINELKRVIVIRNDFENKEDRAFSTFINPEIIKSEGEPIAEMEGCLSIK